MKKLYSKENDMNYLAFVPAEEGHILLTGGTRIAGKSVSMRGIMERLKSLGWIIIEIGDPKNEMEGSYSSFPAKNKQQRQQLSRMGLKPKRHKLKMYHVLTDNLTTRKIPETEFYNISIKDLGENELRFIFENPEGTAEIDSCKNVINRLSNKSNEEDFFKQLGLQSIRKKNVGLDNIDEYDESSIFVDNEDTHFLNLKTSQRRELDSIFKKFGMFRNDGITLMPKDHKLDLDIKKILHDNSNYHFFNTKYLRSKPKESKKIRIFLKLHIFLKIINNIEYAKHPVFIFLDELRLDIPRSVSKREEGHKVVLSDVFADELSASGGKGRGVLIGATSQIYSQLNPSVADEFTSVFLGKLGGSHKEMKNIIEIYNKSVAEELIGLRQNEFVKIIKLKGGKIYSQKVILPPPCHSIAEREDNFFELWKKYYPNKIKSYKPIVDELNSLKKEWVVKRKEEIRRMVEKKKSIEKKKKIEEAKKQQEVSKDIKEERKKARIHKHEMIIKDILEAEKEGKLNYSQIAKKHGVDVSYPKRIYDRYIEKKEKEENDSES